MKTQTVWDLSASQALKVSTSTTVHFDLPNCRLLRNILQKRDSIESIIEIGTDGFCRSVFCPKGETQHTKKTSIGNMQTKL